LSIDSVTRFLPLRQALGASLCGTAEAGKQEWGLVSARLKPCPDTSLYKKVKSEKQVPPLHRITRFASDPAPVGMTYWEGFENAALKALLHPKSKAPP
jgi:hypothetical protein